MGRGSVTADPARDAPVRALEEHFVLGAELGRGGFGAVREASPLDGGPTVAVKIPVAEVSADAEGRTLREARLLSGLSHPNLVGFVGCFRDAEGRLALVYERLHGRVLSDVLLEGLPDAARFRAWTRDLASGLSALHERGFVHRDLKPANVMVEPTGRLRLFDFGLLKPENVGATVTDSGLILGTPAYMAPEQFTEPRVTHSADVYALGCLLYHSLAGQPPFKGPPVEVMRGHVTLDPPPMKPRAGIPVRALEPVVRSALAKKPGDRPATALALAEAVEAALGKVEAVSGAATQAVSAPPKRPRSQATSKMTGRPPAAGPKPEAPPPSAAAGPGWWRPFVAGAVLGTLAATAACRIAAPAPPTTVPSTTALAATPAATLATAPAPEGRGPRLPPEPNFTPDVGRLVAEELGRPPRHPSLARAGGWTTDPLEWSRLVRSVSALEPVLSWLDNGGRPWELDAEHLEVFAAADRAFASTGLRPPFRCIVAGAGRVPPPALGAELARPFVPPSGLDEPLTPDPGRERDIRSSFAGLAGRTGWCGRAARRFADAVVAAQLALPRLAARFATELPDADQPTVQRMRERDLTAGYDAARWAASARRLAPWLDAELADVRASLEDGLYAAARAVVEERAEPEQVAWQLKQAYLAAREAGAWAAVTGDPVVLCPGLFGTPPLGPMVQSLAATGCQLRCDGGLELPDFQRAAVDRAYNEARTVAGEHTFRTFRMNQALNDAPLELAAARSAGALPTVVQRQLSSAGEWRATPFGDFELFTHRVLLLMELQNVSLGLSSTELSALAENVRAASGSLARLATRCSAVAARWDTDPTPVSTVPADWPKP